MDSIFCSLAATANAAATAIHHATQARQLLALTRDNNASATAAIACLSRAADAIPELVDAALNMGADDDPDVASHAAYVASIGAAAAIDGAAAAIAFAKAIAHAALYCRAMDMDLIDAGVDFDAAIVAVDKGIDALADAVKALDQ